MEQTKISTPVIFKWSITTFLANIRLYLQIAAVTIPILSLAQYFRYSIGGTGCAEGVPCGYSAFLRVAIFQILLQAGMWGGCVGVAERIISTGKSYLFDFVRSLKYIAQFFVIQAVFTFSWALITLLKAYVEGADFMPHTPINVIVLAAWIVVGMPWIFAWVWQFYGQLAIPFFVIEKNGISKSILASIALVHRAKWQISLLIIAYNVSTFILMIPILTISKIGHFTDVTYLKIGAYVPFCWKVMTFVVQYPLYALAYVYLYKQLQQQKTQSAINTTK